MPSSRRKFVSAALAVVALASGCAVGTPEAPTDVTNTEATLKARVYTSFGGPVSYWFRYGKTTAYGTETSHWTIDLEADSGRSVSEPISGLSGATTYHWQVCSHDTEEQPARTVCSGDAGFTTVAGGDAVIGRLTVDGERFDFDARSDSSGRNPRGTVNGAKVVCLSIGDRVARIATRVDESAPFVLYEVIPGASLLRTVASGESCGDFAGASILEGEGSPTVIDDGQVVGPPDPPSGGLDAVSGEGQAGASFAYEYSVDAGSGPEGENPTGTVTWVEHGQPAPVRWHYEGSVTCLRVDGPRAFVGVDVDPEHSYLEYLVTHERSPLDGSILVGAIAGFDVVGRGEPDGDSCTPAGELNWAPIAFDASLAVADARPDDG